MTVWLGLSLPRRQDAGAALQDGRASLTKLSSPEPLQAQYCRDSSSCVGRPCCCHVQYCALWPSDHKAGNMHEPVLNQPLMLSLASSGPDSLYNILIGLYLFAESGGGSGAVGLVSSWRPAGLSQSCSRPDVQLSGISLKVDQTLPTFIRLRAGTRELCILHASAS